MGLRLLIITMVKGGFKSSRDDYIRLGSGSFANVSLISNNMRRLHMLTRDVHMLKY